MTSELAEMSILPLKRNVKKQSRPKKNQKLKFKGQSKFDFELNFLKKTFFK